MSKSLEYMRGFNDACVFAMDLFESRRKSIVGRGWLRKKDIELIIAILDAMFRARYRIAEVGPRGMDLVVHRDGSFEFKERQQNDG